jgi:hypothetical protein
MLDPPPILLIVILRLINHLFWPKKAGIRMTMCRRMI